MSAETIARIMNETSARLAIANSGAETQAIGIDHMTKMGADLAEALFTRVSAEPFTDAQVNVAILQHLEGLQLSVAESFAAFGITDDPFLDRCLEASAAGFLDRGEALFWFPVTGGAA